MIFLSRLKSGKVFVIVGVNIPDRIHPIKHAIKNNAILIKPFLNP